MMMVAWAVVTVVEVEKSTRFSIYFKEKGKRFADGLDKCVWKVAGKKNRGESDSKLF